MRALLAAYDKTGLVELGRGLVSLGWELIATGGTEKALQEAGVPVTSVSAVTGFPEILDGRVKTLHPAIYAGLLARRSEPSHMDTLAAQHMTGIDLVACNLYPFEQTVAKPHVEFEEAIENIDIGGPSMLRSAAKNHESVTVVCDPDDYTGVLAGLANPATMGALRRRLALKVFQRTGAYDTAIARYLEQQQAEPDLDVLAGFPASYSLALKKAQSLRYGENPHQKAALYGTFHEHFQQLQGKELSYNNILDITSATRQLWLRTKSRATPAALDGKPK